MLDSSLTTHNAPGVRAIALIWTPSGGSKSIGSMVSTISNVAGSTTAMSRPSTMTYKNVPSYATSLECTYGRPRSGVDTIAPVVGSRTTDVDPWVPGKNTTSSTSVGTPTSTGSSTVVRTLLDAGSTSVATLAPDSPRSSL